MDLIRRNLPPPTVKSQSPCDSGWSQAPVASKDIHAPMRAMNHRQQSIDSYMHRDLTQPRHLMNLMESVNKSK
ncbi:hypothetical protein F511_12931 [Dorcoceras hygrometricum]|uniref:Uncharacterized protein n=1 Tax=Dorcoceras hygrometricum TaxID=472368 RepID=A0A2Z7BEW4_9LAMI|nr:hypothetical protein F511_12931 [Dorcoceras hygrometricum]